MGSSGYGKSVLEGTGVVFAILPIIAVGLRFYARSLSRASLGIDDWVMIPALVICVTLGAVQIVAAAIGELGEHQTLGPNGQLVHTPQLLSYEKCKYILQVLGTLELAVIKLSILVFYRRVFAVQTFRIINNVALAIVVSWGLSFTLVVAFQCTPVSTIWNQFELDYTPHCIKQQQYYLAVAVTRFLFDVIIFTLPLPIIFRLQMPTRQKFAIAAIFLLSSIVVACSITRIVIFAQTISFTEKYPLVYFTDITFYTANTLFWTFIENSIGIIGACLPTLRPLFVGLHQHPKPLSESYNLSRRTQSSIPGLQQRSEHRLSIDSGSALRLRGDRPGHSNEAYVGIHGPLDERPREGILVQRGFYGGEV